MIRKTRNPFEVLSQILNCLSMSGKRGYITSQIMRKANLDTTSTKNYIVFMLKKGLIIRIESHPRDRFKLTEKGIKAKIKLHSLLTEIYSLMGESRGVYR